jgi:CubicO group peptidase (beta-lactamase class C family)
MRDPITSLLPYLNTGGRRIEMPEDLASISTINTDRECDPASVDMDTAAVEAIWDAVTSYYRTGLHPAISVVVRRRGRIIVSRGIGHAHVGAAGEFSGDHHNLVDVDTPICLYSSSKAITAMIIHKLAEEGLLSINDRVEKHLPLYGIQGKQKTTILDLLNHRAGIHRVPLEDVDQDILFNFDEMVKLLCRLPATTKPGKVQTYHAVTAGYVLGAIAMKVSRETLPALLKRIIADPLGCTHMTFGLPEDRRHEAALSQSTGPGYVPIATEFLRGLVGVDESEVTGAINSEEGMTAVIPAANIYATAEEACRFYQMLLDGGRWEGREVFKPETVATATQPGKLVFDRAFKSPMRFTPGFMNGEKLWSVFGFNTPRAFGHLGFINILCWADPDREISAAFLNTGKNMAPEGLLGFANVCRVISQVSPRI